MTSLLVGVDGSEASALALQWAVRLGHSLDHSRLLIATVYVADPLSTRGWDEDHDRARMRLEEWCLPARAAGIAYDGAVLDGESGPALLDAATKGDVDLIIVSRRGRGGFDALVAGSTADYLSHHTRRPLAVVPPQGAESPPAHLLVALDGSPGAAAAAAWTASTATSLHARVTAAHVAVRPEIDGWITGDPRTRALPTPYWEWVRPLRDAGLAEDCQVLDSLQPADALMRLAHATGADAIVTGARAISHLRPLRVGGVTIQLLHHSDLPVIAVPPPINPS